MLQSCRKIRHFINITQYPLSSLWNEPFQQSYTHTSWIEIGSIKISTIRILCMLSNSMSIRVNSFLESALGKRFQIRSEN